MCGRFTQERPTAELAELFDADDRVGAPGGRFNVAPTDQAAVVVQRDDRRTIRAYRWGLIPHWAKDAKAGGRAFNARAETLARSPAFRDALRRHRCVVPVDSFYEWHQDRDVRQPFRVLRSDGRPLALAGLWSTWKIPGTDDWLRSFTIITGEPDDVVRPIHDRMPVILEEERWRLWLDPAADPAEIQALLMPSEGLELVAYPVSRLVNDVRVDSPELIAPLEPGDRS